MVASFPELSRDRVSALLAGGVAQKAFPGAVAMWGLGTERPEIVWVGQRGSSRDKVPVSFDLIYDLASLTKVICTTSLALIFHQRGLLDLHQPMTQSPLAKKFKSSLAPFWGEITPAHLLAHQSGLVNWRPFYGLGGNSAPERRRNILAAIFGETLQVEPGERTIYSDLNFILLGFLLESLGGESLAEMFQREVARPLGLEGAGYQPRSGPLAPTEDGFRYGGPVGHPEAAIFGPTPLGQVHDDNARWLGGVAGHAGLFAPAASVWKVAADWALAWDRGWGRIFQREALATFLTPRPTQNDCGRPLGFNQLSAVKSLEQSILSQKSAGHLGYTGPALWWDRESNFIWLLLCNRVHPRATNPAWSPGRYCPAA